MWTYTAYNGAGNATGTDVFGKGTYEYMTDTVVKNWKQFQSQGGVIMNPMMRSTRVKYQEALTYASVYRTGYPSQWYMYSGNPRTMLTHGANQNSVLVADTGSFLLSYDDVNRLDVEISTKVLSQIGRASTDSWENLAETKKTLDTLWSPLSSWFQFERKAKAASLAMSSANAWLMYRYGIRPLVGSVHDVMKAVERGLVHERKTTRAHGTLSTTRNRSYNHATLVPATVSVTESESVVIRAMSLDELVADWKYQYGFDAKSLMILPWNLVGYSFVVDWFANVGDLIGALGQAFYPSSLGRCRVVTQTGTSVQDGWTTGWAAGYTVTSPQRTILREDKVLKTRTPGLRSPGLVIKHNFGLDNLTRLGDAVSLVGQQILRRFAR